MWFSHSVRNLVCLAITSFAAVTAATAEAQIILRRGPGISVNVPGVGGIRLGAPGIYARTYGLSRRAYIAPVGPSYGPGYANPNYPAASGRAAGFAPRALPPSASARDSASMAFPSGGELRTMSDNELLNAVLALFAQFDADLNRFDTGDTWQRYLLLPEDSLPPPGDDGRVELGVDSLIATLKRFDRTVANPEFTQISGLPSFTASHAALAEVVRRFGRQATESYAPDRVANRRIPPAIPTPPSSALLEDSAPRSIAARNRHGTAQGPDVRDAERNSPRIETRPSNAEELPSPSPSLAAPTNGDAERSILAD